MVSPSVPATKEELWLYKTDSVDTTSEIIEHKLTYFKSTSF